MNGGRTALDDALILMLGLSTYKADVKRSSRRPMASLTALLHGECYHRGSAVAGGGNRGDQAGFDLVVRCETMTLHGFDCCHRRGRNSRLQR